jgi:restriction endonuclease fold toxin 7 of polymorphic toxin system
MRLMRRALAFITIVLGLTLLAAQPASAAFAAHVENRVSGSASVPNNLIGIEPRLSEEAVREKVALVYELASDDAVATREGLQTARQLGRAGEAAAGIVKNTERIASATGTAAYRVPDILNHTNRVIGEVKNVGSLSFTSQLRDTAAYAARNGYTFELWVRPTTQLSGPLQQAVTNGEIVLRFLP